MSELTVAPNSLIEDAASGLISFVKTVRKHWPLVGACLILCLGATLFYTRSQPKVYQALALMEFDMSTIRPLQDRQGSSFMSYWDNKDFIETQCRIVTSERVMTRVVRDLGLQHDKAFLGQRGPNSPTPAVEDVALMLRSKVTVEAVKYSKLVKVRVEDTDPKRAARLCDAVMNAYINQNLEKTINATSDAVVWLNGQVDHFKSELETNENALHDFKLKNDLPSTSINEASNMLRVELLAFNEALTHTRTKKQELLARHAELSKIDALDPAQLPASELLNNSFLGGLRTAYLSALKDRSELIAEGKGENHPRVRSVEDKLQQTRASLFAEVKNIQGAVERDLAVLMRQEAGEASLYNNARKRAVELNMKEIEYHRLDRSREQNEKLYAMLIERMKETDLARMMNVNNVRVLDMPHEPKAPIRPSMSLNLALGGVVGLLLGLIAAWVRENLDSSVKTPDDVESKLGVTFLGLLPQIESAAGGGTYGAKIRRRRFVPRKDEKLVMAQELIVHEKPLSGIAEAARTIRTNLMFMNPDRPYRKLLVSSAAPAEGKTTVACSIAIALAQGGQRVCIVDCDLRRPRLHRIFDRTGEMGVTNVLVGEATMEEVAKPTKIENLYCIPAGPLPPNAADVLHSAKFRDFLDSVGAAFDRVIIDSPPLVAVTDAAIISTLADGTLFVLRAFSTTKALSRQGLRALADVDAPVVGAILNAVDLSRNEYGNYQAYYYYKREGYGPRQPPRPTPGGGSGGGESDDLALPAPPN